MKERLGFIGLGIMGRPMSKNLLKAGYPLTVYDISENAVKELTQAGAEAAGSPEEVAKKCRIVITMLPNSPHVRQVVLGDNGVLRGAAPGSVIIDASSIAPLVSKELYAAAKEKGVEMLDAPVSGGEPKAIDGTLSFMVGGDESTFNKVKDILAVMGSSVVLVGESGSGNTTKLANQIIVALNIAAMSEALVLAAKAGVDPEKVYQAIRGGLAGSTVLDAKAPMIFKRNFKPGFRVDLHIKDLNNALETSHSLGVPLPLTSEAMEILQALKADGKEKQDHDSIVQFYEKLAHIEIGSKDAG
jgi:2-hydroxy-3-oxopropionate reductase